MNRREHATTHLARQASHPHNGLLAIVGTVYLLLFCIVFFRETLPNTQVARLDAWQWFVGLFPDLTPPLLAAAADVLTSPHMQQRVVPLLWATWVLCAVVSSGAVLVRILRLSCDTLCMAGVLCFGLGAVAISTATLLLGLVGLLESWFMRLFAAASILAAVYFVLWRGNGVRGTTPPSFTFRVPAATVCSVLVLTVTGLLVGLGSLLPATDFDVREYHLQGPKEYFLAGRIDFLPHNVYTNMPFGTEMLTLFAMANCGDWWWGALAGQTVLAFFPLMTVLVVRALALRLFGGVAAEWATVIAATVPWFYRIGIIPYAEGGYCFFTALSLLSAVLVYERPSWNSFLVFGLCAGAAFACKYPAVIFVTLPAFCFATLLSASTVGTRARRQLHLAAWFVLGVSLTAGPWLLKNVLLTGNPVYPLAYELFDGRNWNPEKDEKWDRGHSVPGYRLDQLLWNVFDVTTRSDWQSPLVFGLAPLALIARRRKQAFMVWCVILYLFACWWLFTHRIDRFWLPLEPVACLAAAAGAAFLWQSRYSRPVLVTVATLVVYYNLNMMASPLSGNNAYGAYIDPVRRDPLQTATGRFIRFANERLPVHVNILCVGAADLFHVNRAVQYNTVFDDVIFARYLDSPTPEQAIRAMLRDGITHLFFCWEEVERYRTTYGWDERVLPPALVPFLKSRLLVQEWRTPEQLDVAGHVVPRGVLYQLRRASPGAFR